MSESPSYTEQLRAQAIAELGLQERDLRYNPPRWSYVVALAVLSSSAVIAYRLLR